MVLVVRSELDVRMGNGSAGVVVIIVVIVVGDVDGDVGVAYD